MTDNSVFLLIPSPASDLAVELDLPDIDDNIFQRIIRNPHIEASNPRERECTEMLCAVLRNTTVLRLSILRWMDDLNGTEIEEIDDLEFIIDTEGSIGSKRDDLRIEGWIETDEDRQRLLLWTVEVKVGASFHESSPLDGVEITDEDVSFVNQLVNYDHWLDNQTVEHRAGFVLALDDLSTSLPRNLNCHWKCLSWTGLGLHLQVALNSGKLPKEERFLAKHLLGFITNHLWRVSEMADIELNFDDVALVRAFNKMGRDCEDKINRLVEPLASLVKIYGIGYGKVYHQKSLYKASQRSVVYRALFDPKNCKNPYLWAGISGALIYLSLETAPGFNKKSYINSVLKSLLPSLKDRNPDWEVNEDEGMWWDLQLKIPLITLLNATDQAGEFARFFSAALEDLREVGVVEQLRPGLID